MKEVASGSTFRFALDCAGTFGLKTRGSVTFSANRFDGNVTANTNLDRFSTRSPERQASVGSYTNSIYTGRHPMGAPSRMSTINKKSLTETDIRTKFITPAITGKDGGKWNVMTQMLEEVYFTKGRVIVRGKTVRRGEAKKADYIL